MLTTEKWALVCCKPWARLSHWDSWQSLFFLFPVCLHQVFLTETLKDFFLNKKQEFKIVICKKKEIAYLIFFFCKSSPSRYPYDPLIRCTPLVLAEPDVSLLQSSNAD